VLYSAVEKQITNFWSQFIGMWCWVVWWVGTAMSFCMN